MLIYLILYVIAGRNQVKLWKRYPYSFHVLFSGKAFPYIAHKKNIERPFCSIWIFDGRIWQNIYSLIMLQQGCMKFASYWQGFPSIPCWTKCQWWTFATLDILKNVRGDNVLFQRASWPWCKSYGEWCVLHKMLAGQKQKHKNEFLGPRGPLVLPLVNPYELRNENLDTYIQAYMPHESSGDSSNQPDGPMGSPRCLP